MSLRTSNLQIGPTLPVRGFRGTTAAFARSYGRDVRSSMDGIIRNFRDLINSIKAAAPEAMIEALEPTFDKAQLYCPVDTGALVESGLLEAESNADDSHPKVVISFGRGVPYAAFVHERTDIFHKPPTRAKWLQAAVQEDLGKMKGRIAAAMKRRMDSSTTGGSL